MAGPHSPTRLQPFSQVPASFREAYPVLLAAAGLLARNAAARGMCPAPQVKTSLSLGLLVARSFLERDGLLQPLEALGFAVVGDGCMTCAGASGPLLPGIEAAEASRGAVEPAVQSPNRNFEGRVHPAVGPCYLASPALVVAFAVAGSVLKDLSAEPLGHDRDGVPVMLADIWPDDAEVAQVCAAAFAGAEVKDAYRTMFAGDERWHNVPCPQDGLLFPWGPDSTWLRRPPYVSRQGQARNMAPGLRATGRPRAPPCWACAR